LPLRIPVGPLLDVFLVWMVKEVVNVPVTFPAGNIVLALVGTVVLAVFITLPPIRAGAVWKSSSESTFAYAGMQRRQPRQTKLRERFVDA
jgi:hypothetical protein